MRILILGGAGKEGRELAKRLVAQEDTSEIIIADRKQDKAEQVVAEIGKKASVVVADVNAHEALANLIRQVDIVANCVGPFYRYGAKVLKAAIEAKTNYVDICDDADATQEMLELDETAKKAGITAMIGMGSSPGLSNIMCKYGADKLDRVDKLHIYWCVHLGSAGGGAGAGLHGWHMFAGMIPQFLNGKLVKVPARSGAEMVEFPDGTAKCYYLGHSEQVTLPRYIKGVKEVFNKGTMLPDWVTVEQLKLMEMGFDTEEPVRIKRDTTIIPIEVGLRMHSLYVQRKEEELGEPWASQKYEVIGERGGKRVTYIYAPPKGSKFLKAGMEKLTAIPASIGLLMLARGQVKEVKGVVAPEGLIDPKVFLPHYTKLAGEGFIETTIISGNLEI